MEAALFTAKIVHRGNVEYTSRRTGRRYVVEKDGNGHSIHSSPFDNFRGSLTMFAIGPRSEALRLIEMADYNATADCNVLAT